MSINRTKLWLALGIQLLLATGAAAQQLKEDEWIPGLKDTDIFAPADLSYYGNGPHRPRGWFFTIEGLNWWTSAPQRTSVGAPNFAPLTEQGAILGNSIPPVTGAATTTSAAGVNQSPGFLTDSFIQQPTSLDTSFIQPRMEPGERIQLGYINDDGEGWLIGTTILHTQTNSAVVSNAGVPFTSDFVNGISLLEGFIPGPNGVAQDLNGDHVFGPNGRDPGTLNPTPPPTFIPPFTGIPKVPAPTDFGDLALFPVFFQNLKVVQTSRLWSVEIMHLWDLPRTRRSRPGRGYWQAMAGVRYIRFDDNFFVAGSPGTIGNPSTSTSSSGSGASQVTTSSASMGTAINGVLGFSTWNTMASNNLVGPQIALRYKMRGRGRLSLSTEGRFTGAANFQTIRQNGSLANFPSSALINASLGGATTTGASTGSSSSTTGTRTLPPVLPGQPINLYPIGFQHTLHTTQFSPVGELRVNANYQAWRSVAFTVGWTGLVMGGIARGADVINYNLPTMGILTTGNRQVVFIQGVNFGVNINR